MARQTTVRLTDDLDGSAAQTTVRFGWDGVAYEIDLTSEHAEQFSAAVRPYLAAARRVGPARRGRRTTTGRGARSGRSVGEQAAVRDWARGSGFQLADRGRIPRRVLDAYHGAQQGSPSAVAELASTADRTRPVSARKSTGKKRAAAKAAPAAKKTTATKATAKKTTAKKATAKKTSARKVAAKKTTAKKVAARKATARKTTGPRRRRRAAGKGS